MGVMIKVQYPETLLGKGKVQEVENSKSSILLEIGKALQELIAEWMRQLNATRGKHPSQHFNPSGVHEPIVNGSNVYVPIYIAGITRALHDIIIKPIEAKMLALPVDQSAYGISPREWNNLHPKGSEMALFIPKGKDFLARTDDKGNLVVMYLFKDEVHQRQDRTLLPSDKEMNKTITDSAYEAVKAIINK